MQIFGIVGALGLTPLCLVLPVVLHLAANRARIPAWSWWAHVLGAVLASAAGILAAVGGVRGLVVSIQNNTFFG